MRGYNRKQFREDEPTRRDGDDGYRVLRFSALWQLMISMGIGAFLAGVLTMKAIDRGVAPFAPIPVPTPLAPAENAHRLPGELTPHALVADWKEFAVTGIVLGALFSVVGLLGLMLQAKRERELSAIKLAHTALLQNAVKEATGSSTPLD